MSSSYKLEETILKVYFFNLKSQPFMHIKHQGIIIHILLGLSYRLQCIVWGSQRTRLEQMQKHELPFFFPDVSSSYLKEKFSTWKARLLFLIPEWYSVGVWKYHAKELTFVS